MNVKCQRPKNIAVLPCVVCAEQQRAVTEVETHVGARSARVTTVMRGQWFLEVAGNRIVLRLNGWCTHTII